jgi:16S rRNA (uracil1498-N3)-methyltransferase
VSERRFLIRPGDVEGSRVRFDPGESRHIARVLRLRPGDVVQAGDGRGREFQVRLERVHARQVSGAVVATIVPAAESPVAITLAQGIPKGDRMEDIIRAITELGAARVVPLVTERTIVRFNAQRARDRLRRWQRVALEAAKQCGRAVVPAVDAPRRLAEFIGEPGEPDSLRLCCWEGERQELAAVLAEYPADVSRVTVLVGPEGGLAVAEVEATREWGYRTVGLGPRRLRSETAGPAVVAILQFTLGDLGRPRAESGACHVSQNRDIGPGAACHPGNIGGGTTTAPADDAP